MASTSGSADASKPLCAYCKDTILFEDIGFHFNRRPSAFRDGRQLEEIKSVTNCYICQKVLDWWEQVRDTRTKEVRAQGVRIYSVTVYFQFYKTDCIPRNCFTRLVISFEHTYSSHPNDVPTCYVVQLQRCSQDPPKVGDFFDNESRGDKLFDWKSGSECPGSVGPFSGRIRPLVSDTRLFAKWRDVCRDEHAGCREFNVPASGLIDVKERCVVDCKRGDDNSYVVGEAGMSYVALSYVWGEDKLAEGKAMPKLTENTHERFKQPGSLTRDTVLSTIDDAMKVTQEIGERYIWVDCLCIRQGDEDDYREFIPQMHLIYGFASVTIIAASGDNAHAGLPGVRKGSRSHVQEPFTIKPGISLLETMDTKGTNYKSGAIVNYQYLEDSAWFKRGWTFHERIFSRRALIFAREQVYWECEEASFWCEDSFWETSRKVGIGHRYCFGLFSEHLRRPWSVAYVMLVKEYSRRMLTRVGDALDAFALIISALEFEAGHKCLWGLPSLVFNITVSFLIDALIWRIQARGANSLLPSGAVEDRRSSVLCHPLIGRSLSAIFQAGPG